MKTATGYISRKDRVMANPGFTYTVITEDDLEFNFNAGQPITLVDVHPDKLADMTGVKKPPFVAAQLNATHVGKRVRVQTEDGPVVEDLLENIGIHLSDAAGAVIHLDFKNVRPNHRQMGLPPAFPVAPDAPVTIVEESK